MSNSEHRSHPILTLLLMGLCVVATWAYMDRKAGLDTLAILSTAGTQFHHVGKATVAHGNVVNQPTVTKKVKQNLGPELVHEIASQGGNVVETGSATGEVAAGVSSPVTSQASTVGGASWSTRLVQDRGSKPPLASVAVDFRDSKVTSAWTSYKETFHVATVSWRSSDNGLHAGIRLSRDVEDPSGKVWDLEEIPITEAEAFFPQAEVLRQYPMATWSVAAGPATDTRGRTHPMLILGRQWTRRWGTDFGYVNGNSFAIVRYQGGFK